MLLCLTLLKMTQFEKIFKLSCLKIKLHLLVGNAALADDKNSREVIAVITIGDEHHSNPDPDTISLISYDDTTDLTGSLSQLLTNTPATESGIDAADCQTFFEADLPASSTSTSDVGSKTQSLQGTGIEFG